MRFRTVNFKRAVIAGLSVALLSSFAPSAYAQELRLFRIGTSAHGGAQFSVGDVFAKVLTSLSDEAPRYGAERGLLVVAQSSSGSVANIEGLARGALEAAMVQADIAHSAFSGGGPYQDLGPHEVRSVAHLFTESLHIVSRRGAGITSVDRLRDRRVGLHEKGSGTLIDARLLLAAEGLDEADLRSRYVDPTRAVQLLTEGRLDAFFMVAGYPAEEILTLSRANGMDLVPVETSTVNAMAKIHPYFAPTVIPAGTYQGIQDTPTLEVGMQLLVRDDLEEDIVYRMTKELWSPETLAALAAAHAKGGEIRLETALKGLTVPLHPGASRFYRERGLPP